MLTGCPSRHCSIRWRSCSYGHHISATASDIARTAGGLAIGYCRHQHSLCPLVAATGASRCSVKKPLVRPPALPPRGRLLRRPHGLFRWAGRQGVPPRAGVPPLTGPPTDATTSTSDRITRMSNDEKFAARPGMTDQVLYARDGRLGQILLNRPKVLNALTGPMVTSVLAQLQDWAQDDGVLAVSIQGAGERSVTSRR